MVHDPLNMVSMEQSNWYFWTTIGRGDTSTSRVFLPKVKKIGVFITDASAVEGPSDASQVAEGMGYELDFIRLIQYEVKKEMSTIHNKVDAIWLMPDSTFITPDNFHTLIML